MPLAPHQRLPNHFHHCHCLLRVEDSDLFQHRRSYRRIFEIVMLALHQNLLQELAAQLLVLDRNHPSRRRRRRHHQHRVYW